MLVKAIRSALFLVTCRMRNVRVSGIPRIVGIAPEIENQGILVLGNKVRFRSFRLRTTIKIGPGAEMSIGSGTFINDGANIYCSKSITIGENTRIADWCVIYDSDFHRVAPSSAINQEAVSIGKNVWVGARVMILAGASIGDHSVIAAGSVVRSAIPPRCVAAGNPARKISTFECAEDWIRD
jgi:acetyltransferase-like isoleucine patch superfamily enzyme